MSAGFDFSMARLSHLADKLRRSPEAIQGLKEVLAEEGRSLVSEAFESERSPMGDPWAPLKFRVGQILRETNRFAGSFSSRATAEGFEIGSNFIGAAAHRYGATITPKVAKALAFPVVTAIQVFGARGQTLKRTRKQTGFFFAKSVTIPARPMLPPDGQTGPIWGPRLLETTEDYVRAWLES